MSKEDCDILTTIMVIGDAGVGKTTLIRRFMGGNFQTETQRSEDIAIHVKKMKSGPATIRLHIMETVGDAEAEAEVMDRLFACANGILLVYDATRKSTFASTVRWYKCVLRSCIGPVPVPILLVANKCDLPQKQVSTKRGASLAQAMEIDFLEMSAKTGVNLSEAFAMILRDAMSLAEQRLNKLMGTKDDDFTQHTGCFSCLRLH